MSLEMDYETIFQVMDRYVLTTKYLSVLDGI